MKPSDRSIRGALTVLKKAKYLNVEVGELKSDILKVSMYIPINLLTPKKSLKKRVPKVKKVKQVLFSTMEPITGPICIPSICL